MVDPRVKIEELLHEAQVVDAFEQNENTNNVVSYTFKYKSEGNMISGFMSLPKNIPNMLPVIIYNRGGSFDFGLVDDKFLSSFISKIASWGYVVIGTQYPGNHISEGHDEVGGESDIASILSLKPIIEQLNFVDQERIGMLGHSRGGMMTYLCVKQVNWIKTALTIGGMADLDRITALRPEMNDVFIEAFGSTATGRQDRSVINWVDKLNKSTSLCILHGQADARVSPQDSVELAAKLSEVKRDYSLHLLEGGNHYLTNKSLLVDFIARDWFTDKL